jgi:hypothetical protein
MRRKLTIIAFAAMMLAFGEFALAQSPNLQPQVQPKFRIQPRFNKAPVRPPSIPLSVAQQNIQMIMPNAKVLKIGPLPSGDIIATVRIENQVRKIRVDGETGAVQN